MKVALAQMLSVENVTENIQSISLQVEQAAQAKADVIIFPENCLSMHTAGLKAIAHELNVSDALLQPIAKLAVKHSMTVVLGTVPMKTSTHRVRAATLVYSAEGVIVARYDKIHLFDASVGDAHGVYRESDTFAPGDTPVTTHIGELCFGLSICYDLRFPSLFQALRRQGAHVFICPAAFTQHTGEAHWETLLRARAIENQCYMLGVDQGGWHNKTRETYGNTMAVDPWGRVLGRLSKGVGLLVVDLELDTVLQLREKMPLFDHQKSFP